VIGAIVGQALLLGRPVLLVWAALAGITMALFVRTYEEPLLTAQYGDQYRAYQQAVPGWLPRLRPWTPDNRG
jgi:protein-S-isoprenylcysteine O-methyltransferase Ste14